MNDRNVRASHPLLHRDLVVVADGVFSQEVELHHELLTIHLRVQADVLHPQRAAAHRVRALALLLLVTCPQSQLRGEGEGGGGKWRIDKELNVSQLGVYIYIYIYIYKQKS